MNTVDMQQMKFIQIAPQGGLDMNSNMFFMPGTSPQMSQYPTLPVQPAAASAKKGTKRRNPDSESATGRPAKSSKKDVAQAKSRSVSRRNERERNRVKQVNMGFENLRQHVPDSAKNKKMSKVDTLRAAVDYIKQLQGILKDTDGLVEEANNNNNNNSDAWSFLQSAGLMAGVLDQQQPQQFPVKTEPMMSPAGTSDCMSPPSGYSTDSSITSASPSQQSQLSEQEILDFSSWFQY